jgi:phosphoribosylformylglycinamidine (FGAM) synthase-like enzyme
MEDDNTTTDDQSIDRSSNQGSCKFVLDILPRKVPKALAESQQARLSVLKKKTHDLKMENEVLRAENSALKKNIERYYDLVIQARETKKPRGSSSISSATLCAGIILACTVHLNLESDSVSLGERRLMTIVKQEWSVLLSYLLALSLVVFFELYRRSYSEKKVLISRLY